jgi:DNA-binding beta-propeller fold protein YncE
VRVGQGDFVYELDQGWGKLPDGWEYVDVVGVRVDRQDNVYVFNRGAHPVVVFDRDGKLLGSWGEGVFGRPHGLQIDGDDVYCVDDLDHTVRKFTLDGKLGLTIGTPGQASRTGWTGSYDTLAGGPPFNRPTNLAVGANGDLYVSDGYGNCKTHRFSATGELIQSWGEAGTGPGQFRLPHGACAEPEGTILIGDRMNGRVQRFGPTGEYLGEWSDVRQPDDVYLDAQGNYYVAELGYLDGATPTTLGARVTVRDRDGRIKSEFGDGGDATEPGNMASPHGICVDSAGNLFVGEVTYTSRISRGVLPAGTHVFQRFARVR